MRKPLKGALQLKGKGMEKVKFYWEWLHLPKEQFRLLAMIATNSGEYEGNYTDMCRYLSVTPQSRNRNKIKTALETLKSAGYIEWKTKKRTQYLKINPKEKEVKIPLRLAESIINHDYSKEEQVAWEQVLKVYIWICCCECGEIVTNAEMASALSISESTVCSAKNVLEKEYEAITKEKVSEKIGENKFRTLGQLLQAGAWWKELVL